MNNDKENAQALREAKLTVKKLEQTHNLTSEEMKRCQPDDERIGRIDSNDIIDWYYALNMNEAEL